MNLNDEVFGSTVGAPSGVSVPLDSVANTSGGMPDVALAGAAANAVISIEEEYAEVDQRIKAIDDLLALREDIVSTGGMSREFAMEAERIVPGVCGCPIGYFTEAPSATRLKISLENLLTKLKNFILEAVEYIKKMIKKVIAWIIGEDDEKKPAAEMAKDAEKRADASAELAEVKAAYYSNLGEASSTLEMFAKMSGIKFKDMYNEGKVVELHTLDDIFDLLTRNSEKYNGTKSPYTDRLRTFLNERERLFEDILEEGPYTKAIYSVSSISATITTLMVDRVKFLERAIIMDRFTYGGDTEKDVDESIRIASQLKNMGISADNRPTYRIPGTAREGTVSDLLNAVTTARVEAEDKRSTRKYTLAGLCYKISKTYKSQKYHELFNSIKLITKTLAEVEEVLDKLDFSLGNAASDGVGDVPTSVKYGPMMRAVVRAIQYDIADLKSLLAQFNMYRRAVDTYENESSACFFFLARDLFEHCLFDQSRENDKVVPREILLYWKINEDAKKERLGPILLTLGPMAEIKKKLDSYRESTIRR